MVNSTTRAEHEAVNEVSYAAPVVADVEIEKKDDLLEHVDNAAGPIGEPDENTAGLGIINQRRKIPLAGKRRPTTKKEYWSFIFFNMYTTASRECLASTRDPTDVLQPWAQPSATSGRCSWSTRTQAVSCNLQGPIRQVRLPLRAAAHNSQYRLARYQWDISRGGARPHVHHRTLCGLWTLATLDPDW